MAEHIIELKHIRKCYVKDIPIIEDYNLKIEKGEFVTLLGPSGCGKTTILRMIGGFEQPTSGQILLNGTDISNLAPNERPINTVFQKYALFPHLNIYDNIAFGLKLKKLPKDVIEEKVKHVLDVVDLEGFEKRSVTSLSGGQQQRIAIARAIVNEPQILLLDEPLGALDLKMRQEMQLELKAMHKEIGITFIYVTHDQQEALTMSDKIVVMSKGEIQQLGTPEEIYNEPKNAFVADFIGESNIFTGEMTGKLKASFLDTEFECLDDYPVRTSFDAVVRPEDITFAQPGGGMVAGEVISCIFKGIFYEVTVQCGKNEVVVNSLKEYKLGTQVGLNIEPDSIHIMPRDLKRNHFKGELDERGQFVFADGVFTFDLTQIFHDAHMEDGVPVSASGVPIDVAGRKVEFSYQAKDAMLSDQPEEGRIQGHIDSIIYKGDHYSYTVRSKNEQDYFVNDEYLWNQGDYVGVVIPENKMTFRLMDS